MGKNENQCRECCSLDIHKLEEILEPTTNCCIYRVPQFLRKINEEAYSPRLISIGPLHYQSRDDLRGMEKRKRSYLQKFFQRQEVVAQKLDELMIKTFIENEEGNIREHYSVSSILERKEYVEMVLYDAVFIIELFLRNYCCTNDFLLETSQLATYIRVDLLLLENQLPYFVLNHIYSLAFPGEPSFFYLCHKFFKIWDSFNFPSSLNQPVKHFTDLLRYATVPHEQPDLEQKCGEIFDLPNATKLKESGLKFTSIKGDCLLDIRLRKRSMCGIRLPCLEETELQIPRIKIYDETECFFRNMMALELLHYPTKTYVCHYAILIDYLIDTAKNVDLLADKMIIANCMGDNEKIAKMFNRLCSYITPSPSCYYEIAEHMKKHYNNPWNHTKATLKSVYFTNPWRSTATIAAFILLVLTVIQTISSIMQVLMPSSYLY